MTERIDALDTGRSSAMNAWTPERQAEARRAVTPTGSSWLRKLLADALAEIERLQSVDAELLRVYGTLDEVAEERDRLGSVLGIQVSR